MSLRTVDYVSVLNGSADLCGLDRSNISTDDFRELRQAHDRRLQTAWEYDLWPELIRTEKRYYRDLYSVATAYVASTATVPTEVFFPATGKYYQNVKASTGVDPANAAGTVNATNWAESFGSYSPANFAAATTYAVGDKAFYPTTDRAYVLHTAAAPGTLPTDTTKWGVLTDFDPYIAYSQTGKTAIGAVFGATSENPRTTTRAVDFDYFLSENGVQIVTPSSFAWLTYKIRTIRLKGETWVSGTSYVVGDQAYYATGVAGNFYDCIQATSAQAPTNASFWTAVAIPLLFQRYLEVGGYADWLRNNGQIEKSVSEDGNAQALLENQSFLLCGQQGQNRKTLVLTR